jgi:tRNA nucleotidyltransferase (CCA-adding enzyme)
VETLQKALVKQADILGLEYSFIEEQGSTGKKQTQLRNAADIDLFIGLNPENHSETIKSRESIDRLLTQYAKEWIIPAIRSLDVSKTELAFSQHPYVSFDYRDLPVDVLCCFDISSKELRMNGPITTVDRTVHHTRYVSGKITNRMRNDIRILKSFLRACHTYGDRCAVGRMGFTGYSLEILVIQCGGLTKALSALENLDHQPIDSENRTLEELQRISTFHDDHVYIIDPTDSNRNTAASFDPRAFNWTKKRIELLRQSLEVGEDTQTLEILLESPISTKSPPRSILPHMQAVEFISDRTVHYTILRDKLHSLARKIRQSLSEEQTGEKRFGQVLTEIYIEEDTFALGFLIQNPVISARFSRKGPPLTLEDAVEQFRTSHPKTFERDGFVWTEIQRKWIDAKEFLNQLLAESKIKGLNLLETRGEPSAKVLNVLYHSVLPVEREFVIDG